MAAPLLSGLAVMLLGPDHQAELDAQGLQVLLTNIRTAVQAQIQAEVQPNAPITLAAFIAAQTFTPAQAQQLQAFSHAQVQAGAQVQAQAGVQAGAQSEPQAMVQAVAVMEGEAQG
jgi:hypothetical protein